MAEKSVQEAAAESSKRAAAVMEEGKKTAEKAVDARAEAKDKQVSEYYERESGSQPTPTQRENDLAKVGAGNIDEKEDDGSEWDDEHQRRVATEKLNNPYSTVDVTAGRERRGGRKGKR